MVFDKVRENTKNLRQSRRTYAELANLAVNQTLVRSINTSIVALLPVGAILYVGVATLGSGCAQGPRARAVRRHGRRCLLLDLHRHAAGGAAEVDEKEITQQDARAKARARRDVDRYADVPVFTDDMPVRDATSDFDPAHDERRGRPDAAAPGAGAAAPARGLRVGPRRTRDQGAAARVRGRQAQPAHPAAALQARQVRPRT